MSDFNYFTQVREQLAKELSWGDPAIKVFQIGLDYDEFVISRMMKILAADEVARVTRYRHENDKRRYVLTRGFLRILLSGYLRLNPEDVRISYTQRGKPFIAKPNAGLDFNVSHSRDMALIAVSRTHSVGIDVEFVSDRINAFGIAKRVFPPGECDMLSSKKSISLMTAFYDLWTRREAFVKALGEGFSQMKRLGCNLVGDGSFFTSMTIRQADLDGVYSLVSLRVNENYRAALATNGIMGKVSRLGMDLRAPSLQKIP